MIGIDMTGRVTLITGAGGGIGGGIADVFAKAGARVYVADLEMENAKAKAGQLRAEGLQAEAVGLDVTKKEEIDALVDQMIK